MDVQIIGLWVGVAITFVLGLINFLWGPAILARREKVAIVNSELYPEFLPKGTRIDSRDGASIFLNHAELSIEAKCELVLTSGEKELEVKEVEVILNKATCDRLKGYFRLPSRNRLYLDPIDASTGEDLTTTAILQPKKTEQFKHRQIYLNCTDEFEKEYAEMENGSRPEFIQLILDELETNYEICWTRYDGKRLCWRFPDKWWRNLGKKIWG